MQGVPQRGRPENPFADAKQAARERSVSTSRKTNEKLMALIQEQSDLIKAQSNLISSLTLRVEVLEKRLTTGERLFETQNLARIEEIKALKAEFEKALAAVRKIANRADYTAINHWHDVGRKGDMGTVGPAMRQGTCPED